MLIYKSMKLKTFSKQQWQNPPLLTLFRKKLALFTPFLAPLGAPMAQKEKCPVTLAKKLGFFILFSMRSDSVPTKITPQMKKVCSKI